MKALAHLLVGALLILSSASGTVAQTPWFDDFNAGPANAQVGMPWESVNACTMYENVGYFGTMGVQGTAGGTYGDGGRMYRPGGGTNAYMVWKEYQGEGGNPGSSMIGLQPAKTANEYGIGYRGTLLIINQSSGEGVGRGTDQGEYYTAMYSFTGDGSGAEVSPMILGPMLPRAWWEFKIEAVGLQVSSYYREPGAETWTLIGTQTQEAAFAPNYVAFALGSRAFIDDVGFNTETHPVGRLKGHVTLQNYTPVSATPVAVRIQLTKGGVPMDPNNIILDANGDYLIENIPNGTYSVAYTAVGFLREVITPVVITGGEDTVQPVTLINGDFSGDNQITNTDLGGELANIDQKGD